MSSTPPGMCGGTESRDAPVPRVEKRTDVDTQLMEHTGLVEVTYTGSCGFRYIDSRGDEVLVNALWHRGWIPGPHHTRESNEVLCPFSRSTSPDISVYGPLCMYLFTHIYLHSTHPTYGSRSGKAWCNVSHVLPSDSTSSLTRVSPTTLTCIRPNPRCCLVTAYMYASVGMCLHLLWR